ncbi:ybaK/ebsC protein [Novacetimonas hansenii ATCC 23769]|uniref:Cys-tRNA(Pro)/Cys-tRNA(Cys) deacylase n=2 Tax=Novacetimonas hansenii TaxID=436 RepID=D5QBA2_NOVHA|nr:ybaK/ebsC protein [Novacetimonas hansenii ATCC 23769]
MSRASITVVHLAVSGPILRHMSKSTPATAALDEAGVAYTVIPYEYDSSADQVGNHAAQAIGEPPERVFKTLMVEVDGRGACVVVPVARSISMKKVAAAFGGKSAQMMKPPTAERATGFKVGGISPFGQKKQAPTAIAQEAQDEPYMVINGGKRGLLVRLSPEDAMQASGAFPADLLS